MPSDISHPDRKLPSAWKARLSEQQPILRKHSAPRDERSVFVDESPVKVVIEPTEPANAKGLPAFKIKQEIDPQPTAADAVEKPKLREMRFGVLVTGLMVALGALALLPTLIGA